MNSLWVACSEVISYERKHLCSLFLYRRSAKAKSSVTKSSREDVPELALC